MGRLAEELLRRLEIREQVVESVRTAMRRAPSRDVDRIVKEISSLDAQNSLWLMGVVDAVGWPTVTAVGEAAAHAAWKLVHNSEDRDFKERCRQLLKDAAEQGEAALRDFAYLDDRVNMEKGLPQRYGTQLTVPSDVLADLEPWKLVDPDRVDEWRAEVGLPQISSETRLRASYALGAHCRK